MALFSVSVTALPLAAAALGYALLGLAVAIVLVALAVLIFRRPPSEQQKREPRADAPDRWDASTSLSARLANSNDVESIARVLVYEVLTQLDVDVAAVTQISDDGRLARGLYGYGPDANLDWWRSVRLDLENEPSAIASVAYEASPLTIYDVESSPRVNPRLAERGGTRSAALVPVISGDRVIAVLSAATTKERRAFPAREIALLETIAAEAALALERTRSAAQLEEALERERLIAAIGRKVRSEHDIEAVLRVAVQETGEALEVTRCFIRLGTPGGATPIRAEWDAPGAAPIGDAAPKLPVTNLAIRERRTVAIADVEAAPELSDPELGGVETMLELDARAVL
ncbi:MAG TPA: GAF domain-containing protein, partial [Gaiellaceae bacterium]|nr:GAF domain-containing protein [Gaiellaceae bacterium]